MDSIVSFLILFGLASVLLVGIGVATQLTKNKKQQSKEAEIDGAEQKNGSIR